MRATKPLIGVVFDLDGTLAPDTTTQFLRSARVDDVAFWGRVAERMLSGWDQTLAYMGEWIAEVQKSPEPFSRHKMAEVSARMTLYPGVLQLFDTLRVDARQIGALVEFHLISSGLRPIVEGLPIAADFASIWASDFAYDASGLPYLPRAAMSFTDKTRPLIAISKGLDQGEQQRDPFAVNRRIQQFRIPFTRMIYVGDGLTDVPVFALLNGKGGHPVAVFDPADSTASAQARAFIDDGRVPQVAPADYSPDGEGLAALRHALRLAAESDNPAKRTQRDDLAPIP